MQSYCPKGHKNTYSFTEPTYCSTCGAKMRGEIIASLPEEKEMVTSVKLAKLPKKIKLNVQADLPEKLVLDAEFIKSGNGEFDSRPPERQRPSAQDLIDRIDNRD